MSHQPSHGSSAPDVPLGLLDGQDNRNHLMPKINFPPFDDSDARIWIDKCSSYFSIYQIPPCFQVSAASIHMTRVGAHWFQSYKHTTGFHVWDQFVLTILAEFEVYTHWAKTMGLFSLRHQRPLEDYHKKFEHLV
jgi:hypothetical protein